MLFAIKSRQKPQHFPCRAVVTFPLIPLINTFVSSTNVSCFMLRRVKRWLNLISCLIFLQAAPTSNVFCSIPRDRQTSYRHSSCFRLRQRQTYYHDSSCVMLRQRQLSHNDSFCFLLRRRQTSYCVSFCFRLCQA